LLKSGEATYISGAREFIGAYAVNNSTTLTSHWHNHTNPSGNLNARLIGTKEIADIGNRESFWPSSSFVLRHFISTHSRNNSCCEDQATM